MRNQISKSTQFIGEVSIGEGNFFSPGVVVIGPIIIGNNNFFAPNVVIGTPPQDDKLSLELNKTFSKGLRSDGPWITIGDNNVFREFVTVHQGFTSQTIIGSNCYFMAYSHIAHDCVIEDHVKIANNVQMGGYTTIMSQSYIGLSVTMHQFTVIGALSMIGMGSVLSKNFPPAGLVVGAPARLLKVNQIALDKFEIGDFAWVDEYLKSPSETTIHPQLVSYFMNYKECVFNRLNQRNEVSKLRETLI